MKIAVPESMVIHRRNAQERGMPTYRRGIHHAMRHSFWSCKTLPRVYTLVHQFAKAVMQ